MGARIAIIYVLLLESQPRYLAVVDSCEIVLFDLSSMVVEKGNILYIESGCSQGVGD